MSLEIQKFIHLYGWERLREQLHLKINVHPQYRNLWQFNYHQFKSPMTNPVCREARGLILDRDNDWSVAARGYDKFFNYGEPGAACINWTTAHVFEKVDGTYICMYWYDNKWNICTTGTPDGGEFADRFWQQFHKQEMKLPNRHYEQGFCYMLEYVSPETRVVVPYKEPHIYVHGRRQNLFGAHQEFPITDEFADMLNWDPVRSFPLGNLEETLEAAQKLLPSLQEGFVVVDKDFHRLKVKSPLYVSLHYLKGNMSKNKLLEVARGTEVLDPELKVHFPDVHDRIEKIQNQLHRLASKITEDYERIYFEVTDNDRLTGKQIRKRFAELAHETEYSDALFAFLDKKIDSAYDWIQRVQLDRLEQLI